MKTLRLLAFAAVLAVGSAWAAAEAPTEWTGYLTDTHCGATGASKDHTAACVDKCVRGGSKAQIRSEADGILYDLRAFSPELRALVGQKVTITGTLDPATRTITVKEARAAPSAR